MRRVWTTYVLLLVLLGGFGALAWLTRRPDTEILRRAEDWPILGPAARRFRSLYLPPDPALTPDSESGDGAFGEWPPRHRFTDGVWMVEGAKVHRAPNRASAVIETVPRVTFFPVVERLGDWARIVLATHDLGWVYVDPAPPYGEAPRPPLPIPASPPDPHLLAQGQAILGDRAKQGKLGPYDFYTDSADPELIHYLKGLASQVESAYEARYGRRPMGRPAEAVLLFTRENDYRSYQSHWETLGGLEATGLAGHGIVATYEGPRPRFDIGSTLVHELVHLLNRRALGPALPPWLDEGLADDLGNSQVDSTGRLQPGRFAVLTTRHPGWMELRGAAASLDLLLKAQAEGGLKSLGELLKLAWRDFVHPAESGLHYAQSAFLIRYLLAAESGHRQGTRAFLAAVSRGEPVAGELLLDHLERNWDELELGFQGWILVQGTRLPGTRPASPPGTDPAVRLRESGSWR